MARLVNPEGRWLTSRYAALRREELAILLPELLLAGQLIDRSAWRGASAPSAEARWRGSRSRSGTDVVTIFKGLQAITKVSTGSSFTFQPRRSLPITPVGHHD